MSNHVNFQYTKFVDLNSDGSEQHVYYGYRIYDDYESGYDNTYESFYELCSDVNVNTILSHIEKFHEEFMESIEFGGGMFFNDCWLSLMELKKSDNGEESGIVRKDCNLSSKLNSVDVLSGGTNHETI